MLPRLVRLPLTVDYDGDDYTLTVTPPDHARLGAVAVSVDSHAALRDHHVKGMEHSRRKAVTSHTVSGTEYGIPLGSIACCLNPNVLDSVAPRAKQLSVWPGRINDLRDYMQLSAKCARGVKLTLHELFRYANFGRFPCESFSMMRLMPEQEFKISGSRKLGATSITYAYLWCVVLEEEDYDLFASEEDADFVEAPHWLAHTMILQAAAGTIGQKERKWSPSILPNLGLDVLGTFAMAYSNDGAGTIAYDESYLSALLAFPLGSEQQHLYPSYANQRQVFTEFTAQLLQEYDPAQQLGLWLPWRSSYYFDLKVLVTDEQKDVHVTQYGTLQPSNKLGERVPA